jgi:hypothetical protein
MRYRVAHRRAATQSGLTQVLDHGDVMQQSETRPSKSLATNWASLACLFIVLSMFKSNMMLLGLAFLCCGFAFYKSLGKDPQRSIALVVCIALALGAVGYQLGKDAAIRDNAIHSAQKAQP